MTDIDKATWDQERRTLKYLLIKSYLRVLASQSEAHSRLPDNLLDTPRLREGFLEQLQELLDALRVLLRGDFGEDVRISIGDGEGRRHEIPSDLTRFVLSASQQQQSSDAFDRGMLFAEGKGNDD